MARVRQGLGVKEIVSFTMQIIAAQVSDIFSVKFSQCGGVSLAAWRESRLGGRYVRPRLKAIRAARQCKAINVRHAGALEE